MQINLGKICQLFCFLLILTFFPALCCQCLNGTDTANNYRPELSKQFMVEHGYIKSGSELSEAKSGDILLVVQDQDCQIKQLIIHSAVVIGNRQDGQLLIREKFDETHPIVDLTADQFWRAHMSHGESLEVWRKK